MVVYFLFHVYHFVYILLFFILLWILEYFLFLNKVEFFSKLWPPKKKLNSRPVLLPIVLMKALGSIFSINCLCLYLINKCILKQGVCVRNSKNQKQQDGIVLTKPSIFSSNKITKHERRMTSGGTKELNACIDVMYTWRVIYVQVD